MAVALQSFSIREYVAKMRSADIGKSGDEMTKSLPLISFRKFRWWADELETERSQMPAKGKETAPKKRSIVELFAVSPKMEADRDDFEEEERDSMEAGGDRVVPETPRKREVRTKMQKRKDEKLKPKANKFAKKKGKKHKPMLHRVDSSHLLKESVRKKRFEKTPKDTVDHPMQNLPTVKNFAKISNFKDIQSSGLISKQQKVAKVFPVHGILKNQTRTTSAKNTSVTGHAQGSNSLKSCHALVKHVTFSCKDDIVREEHKECLSLELSSQQTLCQIFTKGLPLSSDTKDSIKGEKISCPDEGGGQVVNERDKDLITTVAEKTVSISTERKHMTQIGLNNRNYADVEEICLDETVDQNSAMQICSDCNCADSYSGKQQILNPTNEEGSNSNCGINAEGSILTTTIAQSPIVSTENTVPKYDPTCLQTTTRSVPSTSCSVMSRKAQDIKSRICSSSASKTFGKSRWASDLFPISRDKCVNENFVGLPLNSRGEFIKLHSSGNFGFCELFEKQKWGGGPLHNFAPPNSSEPKCNHLGKLKRKYCGSPLSLMDQLKWFDEQYCPDNRHITSGLSSTQLQNVEIREMQGHQWMKDQNQRVHRYPNPVISGHRCRGFNQTHNWSEREKFQSVGSLDHSIQLAAQPSMRLTGKNVTASESSNECRCSADGSIWTDKEIVTERLSNKSHSSQQPRQRRIACSAFGASERNILLPVESRCHYLTRMQPRSVGIPFDSRQQRILSNGISSTSGDHGSTFKNSGHPFHPQAVPSKTQRPISNCNLAFYPQAVPGKTQRPVSNCNSAVDPVQMGCHTSAMKSHPQGVCPLMPLNSTHCKHSQSLCYDTSSTFPVYIPQCPISLEEQRNQNTSPYFYPFARPHPYARLGTDLPFPAVFPTSTFSFPVCNSNDLTSSNSTSRSTSIVDGAYRNVTENRNGIGTKFTCFGAVHDANLSRKRPADKSDGFKRLGKKPNLTAHWDSCPSIEPRRREQFHGYIPYNTEPPNLLGYRYKRMTIDFQIINNEKDANDEIRASSRSGSLKHDNMLRPGVFRLKAGAKHLLRPCQDNSRSVHSIIPFGIGTSSGTTPVSLKKTRKIYSF